ncbi:GNAT family N-acetyltransferase [Pseudomonas gingeri]|uniref:GNAT family N-acetyltransferase n=1 Tax=Pseudomonas gingeri TaxID=117681 RepID=UPI0015A2B48C|nr:GNAT family N-acetyltransferase [Pseudomonas gingeri]NWA01630.1 GNAT family N-acetyltransferase [Pseudomonas gingeri]NWA13567.1 GNAT family N-acetyltransferase [Pseudomonas gingeri]NWA53073.1 GNAT family N-acetyltransferase [Pseudomonas gingeri]NWA96570.1 GNAT family N-acetyltransferase [Pseudomonas gingeri]NWA99793.1 GNAT family N-acetyltransferase [Pseudomonas gingeri]
MPTADYALLPEPLRPLLNKFYSAHNSSMRSAGDGQLWVARCDGIIAGLCLTAVAEGFWLTGLLVDPCWRGRGIASALIARARREAEGPVWLFCHPDLQGFYARQGFSPARTLPQSLADRLARYSRSKPLVALGIEPLVSSTAKNV